MAEDEDKIVLVVDDSAMMRRIVAEVVRQAGCRVFEAADGYGALARLKECQPDLIILDLIMPGMSGLATLRELRAMPATAEVPIIMLTVEDSAEVMQRAMELQSR